MKKRLAFLLALAITFLSSVLPAAALELEDAKELLQTYYVDPISEEILALDSLEEILAALGDPYTTYYTAEEYQQFLGHVNGEKVVGIGVSIETSFIQGYQIMGILPNSPALEAGLEAGDRIIAVEGVTLTAEMDVPSLIGGEEGTSVLITVIRQTDGTEADYIIVRRSVDIPIVTYQTVGDAGLIECLSFGGSTVATIEEAIASMDEDVSVWIMDLSSNPGGTSEAAAGAAGVFEGSNAMVYFRDANGEYDWLHTSANWPDRTDKPLIVLTSAYSASGSELFSAAARDHGFGVAIGQRTFGKGVAQIVLDETNAGELFDGDALKITAYRFFSPSGATNDTLGVIPTLETSLEHTARVALLLSTPTPLKASGYLKLQTTNQALYLDMEEVVKEENVAAFTELLEAIPPTVTLSRGFATDNWVAIQPAKLAEELKLNYTGRTFNDVAGTKFEKEINTLAAYHLLGGYDDGTFRPENTITRAEFCAMVATAMCLPGDKNAAIFSDVSADDWYATGVSAMAARGFVAGDGDGTFRPNSTITYQEMVTILSSVAAWASMEGYALSQENVNAQEWINYVDYDEWAQAPARNLDELGALVGGQAPTENTTREVAAAMLCSLMQGIDLLWQ